MSDVIGNDHAGSADRLVETGGIGFLTAFTDTVTDGTNPVFLEITCFIQQEQE